MTPAGPKRPDLEQELRGLKDFQRKTVDYVDERLWGEDPTRRFLVADEVGLGKTLVARGVVAKTIDRLWDSVDRIDIVYICSNAQIASQNLARLRVGEDAADNFADRLTLLARKIDELQDRKVNFVSFSPGTSFDVSESGGRAPERVLLYWMLRSQLHGAVRSQAWLQFFRGGAGLGSFARSINEFDRTTVPDSMSAGLVADLHAMPSETHANAFDELMACVEQFRWKRDGWWPDNNLSRWRYRLIGKMRRTLAHAAISALEPDLIILDEFQRFTSLLHEETPGAELARALFESGDARLLLLSATPFKMYSLADEDADEDHCRNFLRTTEFLAGGERSAVIQHSLKGLREGLIAGDREHARRSGQAAETELRRIMARTERLASTPDRDGMLVQKQLPGLALTPRDLHDYRFVSRVANALGQSDMLEYWRSAPYVLELMDGYVVKKELEASDSADTDLVAAVRQQRPYLLSKSRVNSYSQLDPANAKMRALSEHILDSGSWQLAWVPPSLPYYEATGPYREEAATAFTKSLVFSAWNVVPKAVSSVLSYEAERRLRSRGQTQGKDYDAPRARGLLAFAITADRLTGMPVLGLLYPSMTLAQAGDPLRAARHLGTSLPLTRAQLEDHVHTEIEHLLGLLPPGKDTGAADEAWYWAAPMLLDSTLSTTPVPDLLDLPFGVDDQEADTRFRDHLIRAQELRAEELGRRPSDLSQVLTQLAIGGLGVVSLRALSRVIGGETPLENQVARDRASSMAWTLRNHLNQPEMMTLVRRVGDESAYWRDVLAHSVDGVLTSVLDEYCHVLKESLGVAEKDPDTIAARIAEEVEGAVSMRASTNRVTDMSVVDGQLALTTFGMRHHFAVRFGRGVEDAAQNREEQVRRSFNSPFWPFVLSSTSVGQEGLDFHVYSHAVVHWNLPGNPVDLEQREGRVHRYKGHAVRKNVARAYGSEPSVVSAIDPWARVFELAAADRPDGESMIYPYWVFPLEGGAKIERYVPALPLSKESQAYRRLQRTVGAYRLVLGQPRQEDLLSYLGERALELEDVLIDLGPS